MIDIVVQIQYFVIGNEKNAVSRSEGHRFNVDINYTESVDRKDLYR